MIKNEKSVLESYDENYGDGSSLNWASTFFPKRDAKLTDYYYYYFKTLSVLTQQN
jgi:hypothetical protein